MDVIFIIVKGVVSLKAWILIIFTLPSTPFYWVGFDLAVLQVRSQLQTWLSYSPYPEPKLQRIVIHPLILFPGREKWNESSWSQGGEIVCTDPQYRKDGCVFINSSCLRKTFSLNKSDRKDCQSEWSQYVSQTLLHSQDDQFYFIPKVRPWW